MKSCFFKLPTLISSSVNNEQVELIESKGERGGGGRKRHSYLYILCVYYNPIKLRDSLNPTMRL